MTDRRKITIQLFVNVVDSSSLSPFAEALNHVARWNTLRLIQNLRHLFFKVLKEHDQFSGSRQLRLPGMFILPAQSWIGRGKSSQISVPGENSLSQRKVPRVRADRDPNSSKMILRPLSESPACHGFMKWICASARA